MKARIFDRTQLAPGDVIEGPAIIEQLEFDYAGSAGDQGGGRRISDDRHACAAQLAFAANHTIP